MYGINCTSKSPVVPIIFITRYNATFNISIQFVCITTSLTSTFSGDINTVLATVFLFSIKS